MSIKHYFYALRPKHWIKNLFVFLPLVFGGKLFSRPENLNTFFAFILFSLAASSAYLFNDLVDRPEDRLHRTKRLRPVAAGKVNLQAAWGICAALALLSIFVAHAVNLYLGLTIAAYLIGNVLYSMRLKRVVIIDVFCLAFFFLLRVTAGGVTARVPLSHWLIFLIVLLALFLGFSKRRQELLLTRKRATPERPILADYNCYFIDQMIGVLLASIVIVYMLYTVDVQTVNRIGCRGLIYSIPFVYYGIFRYLFLIHKRRLGDDPVVILAGDTMMQLNLGFWILSCIWAIYF